MLDDTHARAKDKNFQVKGDLLPTYLMHKSVALRIVRWPIREQVVPHQKVEDGDNDDIGPKICPSSV